MTKTKWTPETLCAAMEKYVFKTKFTEKDQSKLLEMSKNMGEFDPLRVISKFIDNFDIFGPAEKLLKDLEILCDFPNNAEFLGMKEEMNYRAEPKILTDTKGKTLISITDVFLKVYQFITEKHFTDEVSKLILQSYGNKIYRKLKNSYDLIPAEIVDNVIDFVDSLSKNPSDSDNKENFKLSSYSVNEVGMILSKMYDSQHDKKLLELLRDHLTALNKKKPIRSNKNLYEKMYSDHIQVVDTMKSLLNEFAHVFQTFNPKKKSPHSAFVRIFTYSSLLNNDMKFFLIQDLNHALTIHKKNTIPLESAKQFKNGIVLTKKFEELEDILVKSGLTINDVNIIDVEIDRTSREVAVPIIAPNGYHYKLAMDVFSEIIEIFTTELRYFEITSMKNHYKLHRWLETLVHIFDENIKGIYLIDIRVMETLKKMAHEKLGKFAEKPKYEISKYAKFKDVNEVCEEIDKIGGGHDVEHLTWMTFAANHLQKCSVPYTKSDVYYFLNVYWVNCISNEVTKLSKFKCIQTGVDFVLDLANQMRSIIPSSKDKNDDSFHFLKLSEIESEKFDNISDFLLFTSMKADENDIISSQFFYNDACWKKILDFVIGDWPEYKTVFESIFETEFRKMEQNSEFGHVFLMTREEVRLFCESLITKFKELAENFSNDSIETDDSEMPQWKNAFPIDEYSQHHHKIMTDLIAKSKNPRFSIKLCLEARKLFQICFENLGNLKSYSKIHKERKILMRIFCEMRVEEQKEWHLFSEEVLEAIAVVLEQESRLDSMKEKIDNWKSKWMSGDTLSTVSVQLFKTVIDVVGIKPSMFVLLPDIDYVKNMAELPLKMGYHSLSILSPRRKRVYHQCQAQYLIFQFGALDILWNEPLHEKIKAITKFNLLSEMAKIENGYTSAEKVEEIVERVKHSFVAQKTPITALCTTSFDTEISNKQMSEFQKFFGNTTEIDGQLGQLSAYYLKMIFVHKFISYFFNGVNEDQLLTNVLKAFSVVFPSRKLQNRKDLERLKMDEIAGDDFSQEAIIHCEYLTRTIGLFENDVEKQFVDTHYLFDENDSLGSFAVYKWMDSKCEKLENRQAEFSNKLIRMLPKVVSKMSEEKYEPIENLWEVFKTVLWNEFDDFEALQLSKFLPLLDEFLPFKKALSKHIDFITVNEKRMYKKKKVEILEPVKKAKQEKDEDKPKIVTKYVTETRIVESCEKCREIDKETMKFNRKCEEYEKEIEKNRRIIGQNEEDLITFKNQVTQNKHKYREEIQKQKEIIENRDGKIEQLHDELKQYREDLKVEREKLYEEVRESSEMSKENVRKMKTEVENMKFSEKSKSNLIEKLEAEIEQLKSSLEIEQENHLTTKWELELSQAKAKSLEEQLPQTSDICSPIPEVMNLKSSDIEIVDEVLPESSELKKSEPSYVCLICITDIETGQNSTKCVKCCRKYHSECATSWLRMNSVCPVCKTFLRDPTDYPTL